MMEGPSLRPTHLTVEPVENCSSSKRSPHSPTQNDILTDARGVLEAFLRQNETNSKTKHLSRLQEFLSKSYSFPYTMSAPVPVPQKCRSEKVKIPSLDMNESLEYKSGSMPTSQGQACSSLPTCEKGSSAESCESSQELVNRELHGGASEGGPSSSSSNKDTNISSHRVKKSVFKRAKERLQQSIKRKTPVSKKQKSHLKTGSLHISSKSNGEQIKRSASDSVTKTYRTLPSGVPTSNQTYPIRTARRPKRLFDKIRASLTNNQRNDTKASNNGSLASLPLKRPRNLPKAFADIGSGLKSLKKKVGDLSPKKERKIIVDQNLEPIRRITEMSHRPSGLQVAFEGETKKKQKGVIHRHAGEIGLTKDGSERPRFGLHSPSSTKKDDTELLSPSTAIGTLTMKSSQNTTDDSSSRSNSQKSDNSHKSLDSIYNHIASRLQAMGEDFMLSQSEATRLQTEEYNECQKAIAEEEMNEMEREVVALIKNDSQTQFSSSVQALAHSENAVEFGRIMSEVTESVAETHQTRLALVFSWTLASIRVVGLGTAVAGILGDYCVQYIGVKFSNWLIGQGGWMTAVEESSSSSGEVD